MDTTPDVFAPVQVAAPAPNVAATTTDFPRGGASELTAMEYRGVVEQAKKDVLFDVRVNVKSVYS